ncbi:hypothetical protein N7463_005927 [Penicillium fimorum]|uniref:Ankyrin repeat-containing domain n=1 Tax=Penicillium fimorum TaxID=1882269 RepID=A0A9W9XTG8_9EURO|nr:hypothetical protein N7463_005927 [Penicillium fimorum]
MQNATPAPESLLLSIGSRVLLPLRPALGSGNWQRTNCAACPQSETPGIKLAKKKDGSACMRLYMNESPLSTKLLEQATYLGSEPIVKLLLDHGRKKGTLISPDFLWRLAMVLNRSILPKRQVALWAAIREGSTDMVRFLLEDRVITETQPPDSSFLAWAAHKRDPGIVQLLLAH